MQAANAPAKTVTSAPSSPVPETVLPVVTVESGAGAVMVGGGGVSESICRVIGSLFALTPLLQPVAWLACTVSEPVGMPEPRLHAQLPCPSATYEHEYPPPLAVTVAPGYAVPRTVP